MSRDLDDLINDLEAQIGQLSRTCKELKSKIASEKNKVSNLAGQIGNIGTSMSVQAEPEAPSAAAAPEYIPEPRMEEPLQPEVSAVISAEYTRTCPKCGNKKQALIHEALDKSNIIMEYPRMYGHKYRCGSCACEWRFKDEQVEILK